MVLRSKLNNLSKSLSKTDILFFILSIFLIIGTLFYWRASHANKIIALGFAGLLILLTCYLLKRRSGASENTCPLIQSAFPIVLIFLGLLNCVFFPAGTVPDEPYHFMRSYVYASALTGQDAGMVRKEDLPLFYGSMLTTDMNNADWTYVKNHLSDRTVEGNERLKAGKVSSAAIEEASLIGELPQQKLFSALGILLAKLFNLNHVWLFYLGRAFNAIYAIALILIAVKIAPFGKNVMITASLLPMTLHLIGSYSYDASIIGLAFLATSLSLRALCTGGQYSPLEQIGYLCISGLLAPCKVVYSVICFSALLIPHDRFESRKQCCLFKLLLVLVPLLVIAFTKFSAITSVAGGSSSVSYRGSESGVFYDFASILRSPVSSFCFFLKTIEVSGSFIIFNMVGDSLGWFQAETSLPDWVPVIYLVLLSISALRSRDDDKYLTFVVRLAFLMLCFAGVFGIVLSMWTGWTFITDLYIQGLQGRYLIPLLPMLLLAIRPQGVYASYSLTFPLLCSLLTLDVVCYTYIASIITII